MVIRTGRGGGLWIFSGLHGDVEMGMGMRVEEGELVRGVLGGYEGECGHECEYRCGLVN